MNMLRSLPLYVTCAAAIIVGCGSSPVATGGSATEIGNCVNLTFISASGNAIASLPEEIGNCVLLNHLSLDGNRLSTLPQSIGNLVNLGGLWIENNGMTSLPESIVNCSGVTTLVIGGNSICNPSPSVSAWIGQRVADWQSRQTCR